MKMWLLRLHRWVALALSVPLMILFVTGLILSFEPILIDNGAERASLSADQVKTLIAKHDPDGKANTLMMRAYDGTASIGTRREGMKHIDLASNEQIAAPGMVARLMQSSRQLHEHMLFNLSWLVIGSTIGLLFLIVVGVVMGWPRLRNSVSGWHKGAGWFGLPLLVLSPLTGLALAFGISFSAPPPHIDGAAWPSLKEAVQVVGAKYDLSHLIWIRPRGGQMLARLDDGGEMKVFAVSREELLPTARNWPRLLHEGNWMGAGPALANAVTALAFLVLLVTGAWIWARRTFRRRPARS
ncbi:putative iron-regulated membrane protein [Rhodopseudomonas faecalis]|uniref:Putative iron-regulated membrane protein n=1 Tax=Rhodopseudomonas faecalis TaxID=99655 RepID=A0A318TUH6_9BRAD|nr:putative iron-regulated membrane protein [Rhodopseudomonas faecalis]TAH68528.1 MAG: PepSY domain-containing protein [Rhodopseudomonas palustris]